MSDELKPCPFCGGDADVVSDFPSNNLTRWYVECAKCECRGPRTRLNSQAIAAWNHRPIEDKLQDRIDALEWLRECEAVRRTMREWHPDKRKKNEDASKRRDNAWVGLCHICQNARAAVES